jgi:hypothetical protein
MGTIKLRVRLEPALEQEAALWPAAKRRAMARKLERWARQLRVSAEILERDQAPPPPARLKALSPRRLERN